MPQRFLRPGIRDSEKWNALDWIGQSFYIRLVTLVDDYGRHEYNPTLLRSQAFPYHVDKITVKTIENICLQLHRHDLAIFYTAEGRNLLQLTNWQENPRSKPKYQGFTEACKQMFADVSKCYPPSSSPSPSPSPSSSSIVAPPAAVSEWVLEHGVELPEQLQTPACLKAAQDWLHHKKEKRQAYKPKGLQAAVTKWASEFTATTFPMAVENSMAQNYQGIFPHENRQTPAQSSGNRPRSVWELKNVLEAKEKVAKALKDKWTYEAAMGVEWTNEAKKAEYRALRLEIKELNEQIAKSV